MSSVYTRIKSHEPLFDNYLIVKDKIGMGSFSEVYEIYHQNEPEMRYALKVIPVPNDEYELKNNTFGTRMTYEQYINDTAKKYINEVKLLNTLKDSPNIVNLYDYTQKPHDDGLGVDIYIRTELLTCLRTLYETKIKEPFDKGMVVKLGIHICTALEALQTHENNIIHRDIKPGNIFYNQKTDEFKLGDFGIAKIADERNSYSSVFGTRLYHAPESANHWKADHRSDIYSLGLVMYEIINDFSIPFLDKDSKDSDSKTMNAFDSINKRNRGDKIPLPKNAGQSIGLAEIVLKACEFEPDNRYQSASDMKSDLEKLTTNLITPTTVIWNVRANNEAGTGASMEAPAQVVISKNILVKKSQSDYLEPF